MKAPVIAVGVVAGLFGISTLFGSWYTVGEGERGVLTRNGAVIGTANPGLGFKLPFIDGVEKVSVQTRYAGYKKVQGYSRDQQPADMTLSVNYRLSPDKVQEIYTRFGGEEGLVARLITPRVLAETKTVFGRFTAVMAVQERDRLNSEVRAAIADAAGEFVTIEGVQIENIDFSDAYEASVEQRMLAEVEVQKLRQNAEREKVQAGIVETQAAAKAKAVRAMAEAEAEAVKLKGAAEATAIRARGEALRDNPSLVGLVQAERWDGKLPATMVPGSALPMLSLGKQVQ
ncbi:Regulator of protease activity HflC, stomatin/prohibitin superfamily [Chelatococcus sambhunathii]|uniref:Regulator of protease activity HflC, stomatin/prohibitin superfamily n=1 Tax=Chelatococcus sambhunathii TaxID=363953 RepID=A0ABM9UIC2_9HYPH|nr:prohibitin family protein [Chelatococcus sambhunathii]CUA90982.1 Regulator of protease activity HflC, stomatin/prohibitin superfamily [Chelatococcus sambhunathii]